MAVEIGALRALLSLDSAAFEKGAKRAQTSMNKMQRSFAQASAAMRKTGRQMSMRVTAPIVAATGVMLKSSLSTIDAQAKMAQSLGTTVVSLQNLTRAADMAGVSQTDLEGSLRRLTRRVSLAEAGTGPAVKALKRLGIAAEDLSGIPADERIKKINAAISALIPEAEQAGVASQIFGDKTGLAMLRMDTATIDAAAAQIERFGVAVADVDADQIEVTNDAISALGLVTQGLANQIAVALAPTLQRVAELVADLGAWFAQLTPKQKQFAAAATAMAAAIGPVTVTLGIAAASFAALATPVGAAVIAFGAVAAAAGMIIANWDGITAFFEELWTDIKSVILQWPEQFVELGRDIMQGLIDGLRAKWQEVKDTVTGIGSGMVDGLKDRLGIRSPSKVFAEIGGYIGEGLADGIASQADTIQRTMTDIVTGIITKTTTAKEALRSLLASVASTAISTGVNALVGAGLNAVAPAVFGAPSFAGGGYTGNGPRSGGVDGMGGFPAILHPGETVTDNRRGGGLHVGISIDGAGNLAALVRDEAGRVVAEARQSIVADSVRASGAAARASKRSIGF